jgi:broad specificity phosphatase PhoE
LKRTLQTTLLGYASTIERLGGISKVVTLPQAQECNDYPCDTGSSADVLCADPEFAEFDFSNLPDDWTSKQGFWAADYESLTNRARWVRQFLRDRPEKCIVLVAHGDVLRRITATKNGPSSHGWKNAEARVFRFDESTVESEECFLVEDEREGVVAVAGGYAPGSSEIEIVENGNGKL